MKALAAIGWRKALRYALGGPVLALVWLCPLPLRPLLLRLMGARIGPGCVVHRGRFLNLYRGRWSNLSMGRCCFIGGEVLIDLADELVLGEHVTIAERGTVLTHLNVGYADHPLQAAFPAFHSPVAVEDGCFIGACSTLLPGVRVGAGSFVAAGSVVARDLPPASLAGGVPAKPIRTLDRAEKDKAA